MRRKALTLLANYGSFITSSLGGTMIGVMATPTLDDYHELPNTRREFRELVTHMRTMSIEELEVLIRTAWFLARYEDEDRGSLEIQVQVARAELYKFLLLPEERRNPEVARERIHFLRQHARAADQQIVAEVDLVLSADDED